MAKYKLPGTPEVTVSVRGKDSVTTRQKAIEKITEMLASGEITADSSLGLTAEDLILHEPTATNLDQEDETQSPLESAIHKLQKFSFLKIRTEKLRQDAVEFRDQIETILTSDLLSQEQEPSEESLKNGFKTLKEYASLLEDCCLAKPKAKTALFILDEALQFNLSVGGDSPQTKDPEIETKVFASDAIANPVGTEAEAETVNVLTNNGYQNSLGR